MHSETTISRGYSHVTHRIEEKENETVSTNNTLGLYGQIGLGYTFNNKFPLRLAVMYSSLEEIKFIAHWLFF
jgi:outer membrane protein W